MNMMMGGKASPLKKTAGGGKAATKKQPARG